MGKRKAGQRMGVRPMATIQIRLDKKSCDEIERRVKRGDYQSRSEMIRWAVKKLVAKDI